jgi:hypothetical protein
MNKRALKRCESTPSSARLSHLHAARAEGDTVQRFNNEVNGEHLSIQLSPRFQLRVDLLPTVQPELTHQWEKAEASAVAVPIHTKIASRDHRFAPGKDPCRSGYAAWRLATSGIRAATREEHLRNDKQQLHLLPMRAVPYEA